MRFSLCQQPLRHYAAPCYFLFMCFAIAAAITAADFLRYAAFRRRSTAFCAFSRFAQPLAKPLRVEP